MGDWDPGSVHQDPNFEPPDPPQTEWRFYNGHWGYYPKLTPAVKYVTGPDGWLVPWTQDDPSPVDCALY